MPEGSCAAGGLTAPAPQPERVMTRPAASRCLVCQAPIAPFLSFGKMPIANGFLTPEQVPEEYFF